MNRFWRFLKDEDGLEMSEYALMGALICVALVVVVQALSTEIENAIGAITTALQAR